MYIPPPTSTNPLLPSGNRAATHAASCSLGNQLSCSLLGWPPSLVGQNHNAELPPESGPNLPAFTACQGPSWPPRSHLGGLFPLGQRQWYAPLCPVNLRGALELLFVGYQSAAFLFSKWQMPHCLTCTRHTSAKGGEEAGERGGDRGREEKRRGGEGKKAGDGALCHRELSKQP